MNHTFDVDVATAYGVNAAIVFQDMAFWCEHSRINKKNYHDGLYWTYNSIKALQEHWPYLTVKAIRTAIQKLIDAELLVTGNYNEMGWDRTLWYAVTHKGESIFLKGRIQKPEKEIPQAQKGEPIPYTVTDTITDTISCAKDKSTNESSPVGFDDFWKLYPRKVAKSNAVKAWKKTGACDSSSLIETILNDVKRRLESDWNGKDVQYIPHPATYLNQRRWEDESGATEQAEPEKPAEKPWWTLPLDEQERRNDLLVRKEQEELIRSVNMRKKS